jgi:glutathione S-transferase
MSEGQANLDRSIVTADSLPVLYSFRRCPYAMRARLALSISRQYCALREIVLRDKPSEMIEASPKATVPVLVLPDGRVVEESLDIMRWALSRHDPERWLSPEAVDPAAVEELIAECDGNFKLHLDRYKYAARFGPEVDPLLHRRQGEVFLQNLDDRLSRHPQLFGDRPCVADFAIFPFVRQFANTDREWFDTRPLRNLQSWLSNHLKSDIFQEVMRKWPVWRSGEAEPIFPDPGPKNCSNRRDT